MRAAMTAVTTAAGGASRTESKAWTDSSTTAAPPPLRRTDSYDGHGELVRLSCPLVHSKSASLKIDTLNTFERDPLMSCLMAAVTPALGGVICNHSRVRLCWRSLAVSENSARRSN